ncbi:hypothetical protein, partial [Chitinophaga sp.]|uniref:hypothetical protein n=1 Tax=Chitinophaga sp. TaxID=1869181 RepID=UPI002F921B32
MEQEQQPRKKVTVHDSDYEYVNSLSKSPWPTLIWTIVLSGGFYIFAFIRYRELIAWEAGGGSMRMTSIEKLCYDIGGTWLFPVLIAILATVLLIAGISTFVRKLRLKQEEQ